MRANVGSSSPVWPKLEAEICKICIIAPKRRHVALVCASLSLSLHLKHELVLRSCFAPFGCPQTVCSLPWRIQCRLCAVETVCSAHCSAVCALRTPQSEPLLRKTERRHSSPLEMGPPELGAHIRRANELRLVETRRQDSNILHFGRPSASEPAGGRLGLGLCLPPRERECT